MQYPPIPEDSDAHDDGFPESLDEWDALDAPALAVLRGVLTPDTLVDVQDSFLAERVPCLPFVDVLGRRCLPLHVVEFWYARLCFLADDVAARPVAIDMSYGLAPSVLARADDAARAEIGGGESASASMSPDVFLHALQRVEQRVPVNVEDILPLEPFAGPRPARPTAARWMSMTAMVAFSHDGSLATMGELSLMLGPRMAADARSTAERRFRRVAGALLNWATRDALAALEDPGAYADVIIAKWQSSALPLELQAVTLTYPRCLNEITLRTQFEDSARRENVVAARFNVLLVHTPTLSRVLCAAPSHGAFELAKTMLAALLPQSSAASVTSYVMLNRVLEQRPGLVASGGGDAAARVQSLLSQLDAQRAAVTSAAVAASSVPSASASKASSSSRGVFSYQAWLAEWLESSAVAGPLVTTDAGGSRAIDERASGLATLLATIALDQHHEVLRVALNAQQQPVTQFLLTEIVHPHPLFQRLVNSRPYLQEFLSRRAVTLGNGRMQFPQQDVNFALPAATYKHLITGQWAEINFADVLREIMRQRTKAIALPTTAKAAQWSGDQRVFVVDVADRLIGALGLGCGVFTHVAANAFQLGSSVPFADHSESTNNVLDRALEQNGTAFARYLAAAPNAPFPQFADNLSRSDAAFDSATQGAEFAIDALNMFPGLASAFKARVAAPAPTPAPAPAPTAPPTTGKKRKKPAAAPAPSPAPAPAPAPAPKPKPAPAPAPAPPVGQLAPGSNKQHVDESTPGSVKFTNYPSRNTFDTNGISRLARVRLPDRCWPVICQYQNMLGSAATVRLNRDHDAIMRIAISYCTCYGTAGHENQASRMHAVFPWMTSDKIKPFISDS